MMFGLSTINSQDDTTVLHSFDSSAEGWSIVGDGTALEWRLNGGISGGAICSTDLMEGILWYFKAPYHGDMSDWYGQVLTFSLKQHASNLEWIDNYDVVLDSDDTGETLVYDNPIDPPRNGQSQAYSIALSEADNWRNRHTGELATQSEMLSVLSSLSSLQIRGEYINGADSACLDKVEIIPLPIDWTNHTDCEGTLPSRMLIGYEGKVLVNPPNRLRANPSTKSEILGEIPVNETFTVNGGPTCADGFAWWFVSYDGIDGWTAEASQDTYWIEPIFDFTSNDKSAPAFNLAYGMNGSWTTDFGTILFESTATARYVDDNGRVIITQFANNTLSGVWVEENSRQKCETEIDGSYYWGQITLTPNQDFSRFIGFWGYCDEPQTSLWNTKYSNLDFQIATNSSYNNGRLTITHADNQSLYGYWIGNDSQQICDEPMDNSHHWGQFIITPNQTFISFTGLWGSCAGELTEIWSGQAIPSQ